MELFSVSHSNKSLLKKLLLDSGGLLLALQPLGCCGDDDDDDDDDGGVDEEQRGRCGKVLSDCFHLPLTGQVSQLHSLYFSLLHECLSTLTSSGKCEFGARDADEAAAPPVAAADRLSPPPLKKPRLAGECPYRSSDFDLLLQLDDGTVIPASRAAVAGVDASPTVGSDYFRGLLRGGFGESLAGSEDPIPIRDVVPGMLLPVLHHLHGCSLSGDGGRRGRCRVLDALVVEGLGCPSSEELVFQNTPLGQSMVGASRFLVADLQRQLEDLCVSMLMSRSYEASGTDAVKKENLESTEDNLVNRTSELELTGDEKDGPQRQSSFQLGDADTGCLDGHTSLDQRTNGTVPVRQSEGARLNEPPEEAALKAENVNPAARDWSGSSPAALLLHCYWFSQRFSYPALGRACLSLLLGCRGCPPVCSSSSQAGRLLRRLASEGGCAETLRTDLLSLAAAALSGPEKKAS